ncbi:hypothetical protein [Burkholderia cepacia]|uniref:hypothetical protein n=1 Tax=Burkholderia cepacia TaxID=292 RepID=UPI000A4CD11D|nr:hypothetical protein [Burkholderia cepacia]
MANANFTPEKALQLSRQLDALLTTASWDVEAICTLNEPNRSAFFELMATLASELNDALEHEHAE